MVAQRRVSSQSSAAASANSYRADVNEAGARGAALLAAQAASAPTPAASPVVVHDRQTLDCPHPVRRPAQEPHPRSAAEQWPRRRDRSRGESLGVTGETIRKDLIALERQGLLRRVHGGAVPVQSLAFEPAVETRTAIWRRRRPASPRQRSTICLTRGRCSSTPDPRRPKLVELFPGDRELTVYTNTVPAGDVAADPASAHRVHPWRAAAQRDLRRGRRLDGACAGRDQRRRRVPRHQRHLDGTRAHHARPRRGGRQTADARLRGQAGAAWPTTASSASSRAPNTATSTTSTY